MFYLTVCVGWELSIAYQASVFSIPQAAVKVLGGPRFPLKTWKTLLM